MLQPCVCRASVPDSEPQNAVRCSYAGICPLGGIPRRGIYDNMKTVVDKIKKGKSRIVNARFAAMTAHYLFDPDLCNVASGWEKGVVEKNVEDSRWRSCQGALCTRTEWKCLPQKNRYGRFASGMFDFYVTSKTITATISIKNMIAGIMLLVSAEFCESN